MELSPDYIWATGEGQMFVKKLSHREKGTSEFHWGGFLEDGESVRKTRQFTRNGPTNWR
jgi:hypothetical protein